MIILSLDMNPSPFTQSKYSQPLELVLFHIITIHIKCLKDSYYQHILNNYLINYLNFSGLKKNHRPLVLYRYTPDS